MLNTSIPEAKRFPVPEGVKGPDTHPEIVAIGPFVMTVNGLKVTGMHLAWNGEEYTVFTGTVTIVIDDTYQISVHGDEITFHSTYHDNEVIVVRPLRLSDAAWISPNDTSATVEDMRLGILISLQP